MLPSSPRRLTALETITIRPAVVADVPGIARLVLANVMQGKVLPRSAEAIEATLADWIVACANDEILGNVSLLRYTSGLVEVRSLAVEERYQGLRIGSKLLEALLVEARGRQIQTLFALTRKVAFFERFGFLITERSRFPEKVWHDCSLCPMINNCDETAMVLELTAASASQG
ncbi:MAG TPA: GNAT family N-acetyltransferase [Anaerolineae bacterium]|nr:GNAT family N-acetyltransferase [Anaerolineae bacterium]